MFAGNLEAQIYQQRFINLTGTNQNFSSVGWTAYANDQAGEVLAINAPPNVLTGGVSGGVGFVGTSDNNDKGFAYLYVGSATKIITMANVQIKRSPAEIDSISFVMRDHANGFAYTSQVAVKVAGQWYVNDELFEVAKPAPSATAYTKRKFVWKSENWKKLNFSTSDPKSMTISTDPAANLPAGNLENFGIYAENPGGGSAVIDEYSVWGGSFSGPADASYVQRFVNLTGANANMSSVGWSAYASDQPGEVLAINAPANVLTGGVSGNVGIVASGDNNDKGFVYLYVGSAVKVLTMANVQINRSAKAIKSIYFGMRDHSNGFAYNTQVAVKVAGQWYVHDSLFSVAAPPPATTAYTRRIFNWTDKEWIKLNFNPADPMSMAVSTDPATDLPSGDIENFGIFAMNPGGGSAVIDEVMVGGGTFAGPSDASYAQRFNNLTGANANMSSVGWTAYANDQPGEVLAINAPPNVLTGGVSGGVGMVVTGDDNDKGFVYLYTGAAAKVLVMSNIQINRSTNEIKSIYFGMRDHSNGFAYNTQVAVKIAGQWYVNDSLYSVASPPPAATAQTRRIFFWNTKNWKKLNFDPADPKAMAVSTDPAADLPAGDLENFGFYALNPGGGSAVIDEVMVGGGKYAGTTGKSYEQRFVNLTGANAGIKTVGWSAYANDQSTEVVPEGGPSGAVSGGISGGVGYVLTSDDNDKGFIYMYGGSAANILNTSNARINRNAEITSIDFVMRDHANGFAYTSQVAVLIGGQWYVNDTVFNVAKPAPATTAFTKRTFKWKTTGWKKLIFDPANPKTLAISAEPAGNLPAGNLENFGIYSVNPGGGSAVIDEVSVWGGVYGGVYDNVAPPVPVLTATPDDDEAIINLNWKSVKDNLGKVSYNIYNSLNILAGSTADTTYTVRGLEWDTEYVFFVTSKDNYGNESAKSNEGKAKTIAKPTTDLIAPSDPAVTAAAVKNWVNLSWTASTDNFGVAGYKIYDSQSATSPIGTAKASELSFLVDRIGGTDLAENKSYTFYVAAFDEAGNESKRVAGTATTGTSGLIYKATYITSEMKIDGMEEETVWKNAVKAPISTIHQGKIDDKKDCDAFYKILFDNNNLYLYAEIVDESLNLWDGVSGWPNDKYMFDAVELFFSLTNAYNHAPYKAGDMQLRFNYEVLDQITGQWGGSNDVQTELGPKGPKNDDDLGITHAQSFNPYDNGWTIELKMPLAKLGDALGGFKTNPGKRVAFDINILDNDGNTETNGNVIRDAVLSWGNATGKDTWNNTAYLATLEFVGGPSTKISAMPEMAFQVYPNPVNDVLNIAASEITKVEIYSITGTKLHSEITGITNRFEINTSGLVSGTYILKVFDAKGNIGKKLIIKN